jgi:phenylacetate-CoA ligase
VPSLSPHYQLEITRSGHLDEMAVQVELKPELAHFAESERNAVAKELQHHIKGLVGITTRVQIQPTGGVERSTGKARRVIDRREKKG